MAFGASNWTSPLVLMRQGSSVEVVWSYWVDTKCPLLRVHRQLDGLPRPIVDKYVVPQGFYLS